MYEDDTTYRDPLDDLDDLLVIRAYSPRFWDADRSELVDTDPWEHPSWDVDAALTGWDDLEEAALLLDATVVDDSQLDPAPAAPLLTLVPVEVDGSWPAADGYGERAIAA